MNRELDKLSINAIRVLSADAIEKSKSGHPGFHLVPLQWRLHCGQR